VITPKMARDIVRFLRQSGRVFQTVGLVALKLCLQYIASLTSGTMSWLLFQDLRE